MRAGAVRVPTTTQMGNNIMPTRCHLQPPAPSAYSASTGYTLVLSCVDARLFDDLVSFLDLDNLTNRYYHVTLPGTSLGLTKRVVQDIEALPEGSDEEIEKKKKLKPQFRRWRTIFIEQVQAAVILTKGKLTDIYVVQHEDCGAFRVYIDKDAAEMSPQEELAIHDSYAEALLEDLTKNFCAVYNPKDLKGKPIQKDQKQPCVHTFYMDLRGTVKHLRSYPDVRSRPSCDNP